MQIKKILTPVDGSDHSMNAAKYSAEFALSLGAKITLLHCHRRFPVILAEPHFQNAINDIMKDSEELVQPFVDMLDEKKVEYETRILEGSPGSVIPEVAEIEKMDMIIMGSRGVSDLEGLILGSVTHKVLHATECPVLVLK